MSGISVKDVIIPIYDRVYRKDDNDKSVSAGKKKLGEVEADVYLSTKNTPSGPACSIRTVSVPSILTGDPLYTQSFVLTGKEAAPYLKQFGLKEDFCAEPVQLEINLETNRRIPILTGEAKGKVTPKMHLEAGKWVSFITGELVNGEIKTK